MNFIFYLFSLDEWTLNFLQYCTEPSFKPSFLDDYAGSDDDENYEGDPECNSNLDRTFEHLCVAVFAIVAYISWFYVLVPAYKWWTFVPVDPFPELTVYKKSSEIFASFLEHHPNLAETLHSNLEVTKILLRNDWLLALADSDPRVVSQLANNPWITDGIRADPLFAELLKENPQFLELFSGAPQFSFFFAVPDHTSYFVSFLSRNGPSFLNLIKEKNWFDFFLMFFQDFAHVHPYFLFFSFFYLLVVTLLVFSSRLRAFLGSFSKIYLEPLFESNFK